VAPPVVVFTNIFWKRVVVTNLAQLIPARVRQVVYSVLATAVALEAIFDVFPDVWEGKVLAALTVLGFGVAVGNVRTSNV
jgi:hypothetical protein